MATTTPVLRPGVSVSPSPFPAASRTSTGLANRLPTTITTLAFTDRLLLTITQSGLSPAHWLHVPLASASSDPMNPGGGGGNMHFSSAAAGDDPEGDLLPRSDLTATTLLGGTKPGDEIVGMTLATMIASAVLMKRPGEQRLLVLGLGIKVMAGLGREGFEEV
ncbi:hypothetical protein LTR53_015143, partial [Teratosphaeriaceae sp. CCFEE 6253]